MGEHSVDVTLASLIDVAGDPLPQALQRAIRRAEGKGESRAAIVERMGKAAGIEPQTVNQIVAGSIECPPANRLAGLARALNLSAESLRRAAQRGGCSYD